jgi:hypothetical protein
VSYRLRRKLQRPTPIRSRQDHERGLPGDVEVTAGHRHPLRLSASQLRALRGAWADAITGSARLQCYPHA